MDIFSSMFLTLLVQKMDRMKAREAALLEGVRGSDGTEEEEEEEEEDPPAEDQEFVEAPETGISLGNWLSIGRI